MIFIISLSLRCDKDDMRLSLKYPHIISQSSHTERSDARQQQGAGNSQQILIMMNSSVTLTVRSVTSAAAICYLQPLAQRCPLRLPFLVPALRPVYFACFARSIPARWRSWI